MSDIPFGFSTGGDDPDRDKNSDPFGLGAGPLDPAALGQMLSQFGQMLSGMGTAMTQPGTSSGPVNYDLAKQLAHQQLTDRDPVPAGKAKAVEDAAHLAEIWLDGATTLPAGASTTRAWTPGDWIDNTIDTWKRLCDPVAAQVSGMWSKGIPAEAQQLAGPMLGIIGQMGGVAFGSQLGQALGQLGKEVLTSTDIGLPLGPDGTAALLPNAIAEFSKGLEQPEQEILVFLAAREAAHQRLFQHVPWLRQRLLGTVEEFARGIEVDFAGIEEATANIDPMALTDPAKLQEILQQGAFEPKTTPGQKAALERLETLLALIEGWVETVVADALADRLPNVAAMSETLRRRRATGGPAEQTFATLVGLELRPRKLREAAALWRRLTDDAGVDARDGVWAHPDLLPDAEDLDSPSGFVERVLGGSDAFDDPIAQLKATEAKEAEKRAQSDPDDKDA